MDHRTGLKHSSSARPIWRWPNWNRHLCNQFFKHGGNLDKVDPHGIPTHGHHDLQNRTKMNPSCLWNRLVPCKMYAMLWCHDVMIESTSQVSTNIKHGKGTKVTQRALRFQVGKELRYYPLSVQLVQTCPRNSNRVLEDLNITDYPQSVIIPV